MQVISRAKRAFKKGKINKSKISGMYSAVARSGGQVIDPYRAPGGLGDPYDELGDLGDPMTDFIVGIRGQMSELRTGLTVAAAASVAAAVGVVLMLVSMPSYRRKRK